jgi:predicted Fe-Mo cluster-binding NifX family protein
MKIAIPTRGTSVDDHFGHCESYTLFTVDTNKNIINSETIPSPQGCGCKSNIGAILQQKGVNVLLAGNMGDGALNVLRMHGMEVYRGNSGDVRLLAETYLKGNLADSGEGCQSHGDSTDGHECNH